MWDGNRRGYQVILVDIKGNIRYSWSKGIYPRRLESQLLLRSHLFGPDRVHIEAIQGNIRYSCIKGIYPRRLESQLLLRSHLFGPDRVHIEAIIFVYIHTGIDNLKTYHVFATSPSIQPAAYHWLSWFLHWYIVSATPPLAFIAVWW